MSSEPIKQVKALSGLRSLLTQNEPGREDYLYPLLEFGDVWWIPDEITGFSRSRERHPWVIVNGYSPQMAIVIICPRTSTYRTSDLKRGLLTPANVLPGLDKEGLIILKHRRPFVVETFRDYEYIGKLPEYWIKNIHDFNKLLAEGRV